MRNEDWRAIAAFNYSGSCLHLGWSTISLHFSQGNDVANYFWGSRSHNSWRQTFYSGRIGVVIFNFWKVMNLDVNQIFCSSQRLYLYHENLTLILLFLKMAVMMFDISLPYDSVIPAGVDQNRPCQRLQHQRPSLTRRFARVWTVNYKFINHKLYIYDWGLADLANICAFRCKILTRTSVILSFGHII